MNGALWGTTWQQIGQSQMGVALHAFGHELGELLTPLTFIR